MLTQKTNPMPPRAARSPASFPRACAKPAGPPAPIRCMPLAGDEPGQEEHAGQGHASDDEKRHPPSPPVHHQAQEGNAQKGASGPAHFEDPHGKSPPLVRHAGPHEGENGGVEDALGGPGQHKGRKHRPVGGKEASHEHPETQDAQAEEHDEAVAPAVCQGACDQAQETGELIDRDNRGDCRERNVQAPAQGGGERIDEPPGGVDQQAAEERDPDLPAQRRVVPALFPGS